MTLRATPFTRVLVTLAGVLACGPFLALEASGTTGSRTAPGTASSDSTATQRKASSTARASSSKKASTRRRYSSSRSRARRARLARARAAQRAREMRELAVPRFKVGEGGAIVPDVRAAAAVIYDPSTQEVLWEENGQDPRSIASITKVMTAVVYLTDELDVTREVEIAGIDVYRARHTYLRGGERVRIDDLVHLLLIASDNAAARTLARISPWGPEGFVDHMNATAQELGLTQTHYADPSGLDPANVSSARDMARLIAYASADERIASVMRKADHQLTTSRRTLTVHNTNRLLGTDLDVRGGKTGFIRSSGYCLATLLRLPQTDQQVAVVILGARSSTGRFMETRHLANWATGKAQQLLGVQSPSQ
jgi:D-alanyl-D-alanine endopeptidase (penicillin-binding protein 7)